MQSVFYSIRREIWEGLEEDIERERSETQYLVSILRDSEYIGKPHQVPISGAYPCAPNSKNPFIVPYVGSRFAMTSHTNSEPNSEPRPRWHTGGLGCLAID